MRIKALQSEIKVRITALQSEIKVNKKVRIKALQKSYLKKRYISLNIQTIQNPT